MRDEYYLGDGRVGRPRGNEGHGGGGGVVGDHGLLDLLLHIADVPQGPDRAHALQHHGHHCHQGKKMLCKKILSLL